MNFKKNKIIVFFLILIAAFNLWSQTDFQDLFNEGVIHYRNENFDQAKLKFLTIASQPQNNPNITSAYLMLAKTNEKLRNYQDALLYSEKLINEFPKSDYLAEAHFVSAIANYYMGSPANSLQSLAFAIESSNSTQLMQKCELYATQLVQNGIPINSLENVHDHTSWKKSEPLFLLWLARTNYKNGQKANGDKYIDSFLNKFPKHRYAEGAERLKATPIDEISQTVKIGILLPISGLFSAEATDLMRGMAFSLKNRKKSTPEIEIYLKDTKGSAVETVKSTLSLIDQDVNLVIGELESNKSSTVAGVMANSKIPLIIPIATENGLATISANIFQMNNDLETRGAQLAEYAFKNMGLRTFATLAPADEYGNALSDAFSNKIDELGGTILAQQWYYPGTPELKRQFDAIRESGIRYALRDSIAHMKLSVTPQRLDSLCRSIDRYVKRRSEDRTGVVESYNIPVTSIDGLFMPTYEEDIDIVAPQYALSNLSAKVLGGDYWNNGEVLRKQRSYLNGSIFIAGNYFPETDLVYRDFVNKFRQITSASPGVMAIYGYNVMNILIDAVDQGKTSSSEIIEFLENLGNYEGLGSEFTFSKEHHVNQAVNILQFQDGNIYNIESEELRKLLEEK